MGCAVSRVLVAAGWSVSTHLWGPSLTCRAAAEAAGITDLGSLDEVIGSCDVVVSLVPPAAAVDTAKAVSAAAERVGRRPLYLDANSVGPSTMAAVAATCDEAGLDCLDGSFIGSAADLGRRTRLYLSGPRAVAVAGSMPETFHTAALGPRIGAASAFKLAFAGFNKGLVALFLDVMQAGVAAGRADELLHCLREFYPGTVETLERLLPSYPLHAGRRAEEMGELAEWMAGEGRRSPCAEAARDVLQRAAALGLDGSRRWTFAEAVEAYTKQGSEAGGGEPE
jgi:3-hydroxyisobutyrate dehydrogenase-like beta-hydroxyacid dehydrogenase